MYSNIKEDFKKIITNAHYIEDPQVDELFIDWEKNKQKFINAFGGLIYEYPEEVEFSLEDASRDGYTRFKRFKEVIRDEHPDEVKLIRFLEILTSQEFYENQLSVDLFIKNDSVSDVEVLGDSIKIPKGTKVIKAFKFFVKDPKNLPVLRKLQDSASQVIQHSKTIKGKLCLSVHPLDYLTMSNNSYGWSSCHSIDGEYASGNLSYMADDATVICYIKAEKDNNYYPLPRGMEWTDKKWRMILYLSEDNRMVFAGRQYPFEISGILNFISKKLLSEAGFGNWTNFTDKMIEMWEDKNLETPSLILPKNYVLTPDREIVNVRDLFKNYHNQYGESLHYNDVLKSIHYNPPYALSEKTLHGYKRNPPNVAKIYVGNKVNCLYCGKDEIAISEGMMCVKCYDDFGPEEGTYVCENCGHREIEGYEFYINDVPYCESCFDEIGGYCDNCDEIFYYEDLVAIPSVDGLYCPDCAAAIEWEYASKEERREMIWGED